MADLQVRSCTHTWLVRVEADSRPGAELALRETLNSYWLSASTAKASSVALASSSCPFTTTRRSAVIQRCQWTVPGTYMHVCKCIICTCQGPAEVVTAHSSAKVARAERPGAIGVLKAQYALQEHLQASRLSTCSIAQCCRVLALASLTICGWSSAR